MKIYQGFPGTPGQVTVITKIGQKGRPIKFRETHKPPTISWGPNDLALAWICLAILDDVYGPSDRTVRLFQRFKWRISPNLKPDCQWSMTEDEIRKTVDDIETIERATAPSRRMVQLEPTPIVSDKGPDIVWDQGQNIPQNHRRKP